MDLDSYPIALLADLLPVASRVLRDLDADDVPPKLRRVAAAERLPPPLARALIRELDANVWFREKVRDAWNEDAPDMVGPSREAVTLFLDRPEGWEDRLAALATEEISDQVVSDLESLRREAERLRAELEVARDRAKAAERKARQADQQAAQRKKERRVSRERARRENRAREGDLERERKRLALQLDELRKDLEEARLRSTALRAGLLKARRSVSHGSPSPTESAWGLRDPIELARHLDQLWAASVVAPSEPVVSEARPRKSARLPRGMAPDDPRAVDWLLAGQGALTILVDGYNVTFHLDAARFHTAELRGRLNQALADLRALAKGAARIVVVYDSDRGGQNEVAGPRGVEVRFTDPEVLADQEILGMASELAGFVVVVSSDRLVRESAEAEGAMGIWSEALAGWINR